MTVAPTREQHRRMRQRRLRRRQQEQEPMAESKWDLPASFLQGFNMMAPGRAPVHPAAHAEMIRQDVEQGRIYSHARHVEQIKDGVREGLDFLGW